MLQCCAVLADARLTDLPIFSHGDTMNSETFLKLLEEIQKDQTSMLISKNEEYAGGDGDKLANFKKGGRALGVEPEECLWAYTMKHLISIQDIVYGEGSYTPEKLREKCGDLRNYTVLLEALMIERHT